MLVELKNGETLNGHLVNCDTWMNLTLKEVVQTSPDGEKFWRLPEVYVRGNNVSKPRSARGEYLIGERLLWRLADYRHYRSNTYEYRTKSST